MSRNQFCRRTVHQAKQGGASTMITSSRAIGVDYGRDFTNTFTQNIFKLTNDDFNSLGYAHFLAKKQKGPNTNHLKVNFLGDPAMKLADLKGYW
jgi:hypothetical protein